MNKTVSGRTCQKWSVQAPNKHNRTPEKVPNMGLGDHNYCRNPSDKAKDAWCYTSDPKKRWEYCNVEANPVCKPKEETTNGESIRVRRHKGGKGSYNVPANTKGGLN